MKKLTTNFAFATLILALIIGVSSCKKSEVREEVSGTWTITSVIENGVVNPSITGTITFNDCSAKDNRNNQCTYNQNMEVDNDGEIDFIWNTAYYRVNKKGETITINGDVTDIVVENEVMNLVYTDGSDRIEMILGK